MTQEATAMRPWRFMVRFGTVSFVADAVHEGARSATGPLLASLGASAAVVGAVTGGVLIVLPVLSAVVTALAFTDSLAPVVLGALVWGAATGVQEAPASSRGRSRGAGPQGDGVFAAVVGVAAWDGDVVERPVSAPPARPYSCRPSPASGSAGRDRPANTSTVLASWG